MNFLLLQQKSQIQFIMRHLCNTRNTNFEKMNVELFTRHAKDWNLTSSDIEQAAQLFTQDHQRPRGFITRLFASLVTCNWSETINNTPSNLLLFLYAKGILSSESSNVRLEEFQTILTGESMKALERLTTIVEKGERSHTRFTLEADSMFDDFVTKHEEWKGNDSFVVFRDHQDLKGKSHALVERFQKSGLCYMHACVVVQHYLVAMNNQEEVPMLNMAEYLKGYMKSDELYDQIWNNKGGDSLNFLEKILKKKPASENISHCSNKKDLDVMDEYLHSCGPGLVSGFCVEEKFTSDDWQHLGKYSVEKFEGGEERGRFTLLPLLETMLLSVYR